MGVKAKTCSIEQGFGVLGSSILLLSVDIGFQQLFIGCMNWKKAYIIFKGN